MANSMDDEDVLAHAYDRALGLEKSGDLDAAAEAYLDVLKLDPADHCGASVRLAAMGRGAAPAKAPDAYVATLFDQHADIFDMMLVDQLGYSVPLQLRQVMIDMDLGPFERMLDLGCGTGLSGEALRDRTVHASGVDVSENMVEIAHDKEVYEALYVGEAIRFLNDHAEEPWDLVVATDVLPYLGAVEDLFDGVAARITDDGLFCFSTETQPEAMLDGRDFIVGPKQRFAHAADYIRSALVERAFECLVFAPIIVRYDEGEAINGFLVLAQMKRVQAKRADQAGQNS